MSDYIPTIGIECHIQLKTKTKLFAGVDNDAREAEPNTLVSPICFGLPGTLPVLNDAVIELAIKAGIALNSKIEKFSKFDRKHYFYPDLPMGYQITQLDHPIVGNGELEVPFEDGSFKVGITRAHIEADAGKSTHPNGEDYSLVDLNRAGTPLLEIVSEPDIHSPRQARAYVKELYYLIKYSGASDVNLYYGNMRFDVNVSLAKESQPLGNRAEVKNLNSFRSVEKAAEYEIKRQREVLDNGKEVVQETRGWDDDTNKTISQRGKENAHDYRYFPDPDLPPIVLEDDFIEEIRKAMPMLPPQIRANFIKAGVNRDKIDMLLENQDFVKILELAINEGKSGKDLSRMVNWLTIEVQQLQLPESELQITYSHLKELEDLLAEGKVSSTVAKTIVIELAKSGGSALAVAESKNLIQVSDSGEIEKIVDQVLEENPTAVADVKAGEMKVLGFLVGQVMKKSMGKANPAVVNQLINLKIKYITNDKNT